MSFSFRFPAERRAPPPDVTLPPGAIYRHTPQAAKVRKWLETRGISCTRTIQPNFPQWPDRTSGDVALLTIDCGTDTALVRSIFSYAITELRDPPVAGRIETSRPNPAASH
jgi:hypothetical protein